MKTSIDYIRAVLLNVRDEAGEFTKSTILTQPVYADNVTTFTAETVEGFTAGDTVFFDDKTSSSKFAAIKSIDTSLKKIVFDGDWHSIPSGIMLIKSDALHYLNNAIFTFSKFRPLLIGKSMNGNGTSRYDLPDKWFDNFSAINLVEKPEGYVPPVEYPGSLYKILNDENGKSYLQFGEEFKEADSFTLYYTTIHYWITKDDETDLNPPKLTITDSDFFCVCDLAAAYYLLGLGALYGQSVKGTISADNINYQTKTDAYRRLAKEYLGKAANWLGVTLENIQEGIIKVGAASSQQDASSSMSDRRGFLKPFVIASVNYGLYR
jgi:hypothetical protein